MSGITIVLIILWIYILSIFKRKRQPFFFFLVGSVGFFLFFFVILYSRVTSYLARMVCDLTGIVGKVTGVFTAYSSYGVLFIENAKAGPISLYVDFECAGLVEILVFLSLLLFFPAYRWFEKIWVGMLGVIGIIIANILRLSIIAVMIHFGGNEVYYIAHTIVGRFVFYALAITLYFYVFTRRQIKQQKVGEFSYNGKVD